MGSGDLNNEGDSRESKDGIIISSSEWKQTLIIRCVDTHHTHTHTHADG